MVTQEDLLQILVKHDVLTSTNLKENFNLKVTRDCYVGIVARLDRAIKEIYNLGIEASAEKSEVLMTINDVPFVSSNFSVTTDHRTINGEMESIERKYVVYKPSILNLKIK